jgi:hypothetical protein
VFERLCRKDTARTVFLYAFDLLELDGADLRHEPIETRKATLASLLRGSRLGLRLNKHLAADGETVFRHACKMGLEGIESKRLGSRYRSGRTRHWLKFKNPAAPAVKREAEEDWGREKWRRRRERISPTALTPGRLMATASWSIPASQGGTAQICGGTRNDSETVFRLRRARGINCVCQRSDKDTHWHLVVTRNPGTRKLLHLARGLRFSPD